MDILDSLAIKGKAFMDTLGKPRARIKVGLEGMPWEAFRGFKTRILSNFADSWKFDVLDQLWVGFGRHLDGSWELSWKALGVICASSGRPWATLKALAAISTQV